MPYICIRGEGCQSRDPFIQHLDRLLIGPASYKKSKLQKQELRKPLPSSKVTKFIPQKSLNWIFPPKLLKHIFLSIFTYSASVSVFFEDSYTFGSAIIIRSETNIDLIIYKFLDFPIPIFGKSAASSHDFPAPPSQYEFKPLVQ